MLGLLKIARFLCFTLAFTILASYLYATVSHKNFPLTGYQTAGVLLPLLALGNVVIHQILKRSQF